MTKFKLIPAGLLFSAVALGGSVNAIDIDLGNGITSSVEVEATAYAKIIPGRWIFTHDGKSITNFEGDGKGGPDFAGLHPAPASESDADKKTREGTIKKLQDEFTGHINNVPYLNMPWRVRAKFTLEKDLSEEMMPGMSVKASVKFKNKDAKSGEFAIKTKPTLALNLAEVGTFTFGPGLDNAYDSLSFWVTDGNGPHHLVSEDMIGSTPWWSNVGIDGGLGVNWVGTFVGDSLSVAATVVPFVEAMTEEVTADSKGAYSLAISYAQEFGPVSMGVGLGAGMEMVYAYGDVDAADATTFGEDKGTYRFFHKRTKFLGFNATLGYMVDEIGKFQGGVEYILGDPGLHIKTAPVAAATGQDAVPEESWHKLEHNVKLELFWTSVDEKWSAGINGSFTIIPTLEGEKWGDDNKDGDNVKQWMDKPAVTKDEAEADEDLEETGAYWKYYAAKNPWAMQIDLSGSYKFSDALLTFFGVRVTHNNGLGDLLEVVKEDASIRKLGPITWGLGVYGGVKYSI